MRGKKKNLCKLALSSERLIVYQNKVRGVEVDEPKQDWFSVNMPFTSQESLDLSHGIIALG